MATKKKRAGSRSRAPAAAMAPETDKDLTQELNRFITSELIRLQGSGGTRAVRDDMIDILHPDRSEVFKIMQQASARMTTIHDVLKSARSRGRLYPWVFPSAATALFEGIFEACVWVWMLAGDPEDANELKPSVAEYVRLHVKGFAAVVGA